MPVLYFFESIRNPVLDALFSVITLCGEETVFMAVGMIVFWCVGKYQGYFLLCTGFAGTIVNQFLKMLFRVPRPWIKDPDFTIVETAKETATGYSFPSGHTQTSVGLFGGLARWNINKIIRIICISLCVLVPVSRMYLGVHTPQDILVSTAIALALVFLSCPLFKKAQNSPKTMYAILLSLAAITVAFTLFVNFYSFPESVYAEENAHNLLSARKNGATLLGCIAGLIAVYTVDLKWTKFQTDAVWWVQIIKAVGGLTLVIVAKELLRSPLDTLFDGSLWARGIRYFIMVIVGGVLWPLTFKWFTKLGGKKNGI